MGGKGAAHDVRRVWSSDICALGRNTDAFLDGGVIHMVTQTKTGAGVLREA